jgi:hypothetical protein
MPEGVRSADREESSTPRREQEDPRSQCRRPKGSGKVGQHDRLLRRSSRITGRIRAIARTRKGADVGLVGL